MTDDYVRQIYGPLRDRALARVDLAMRVAVMTRAGMTRAETAERLGGHAPRRPPGDR